MTAPRYAIYFAPPAGHPLWSFGSGVLGYDAETGSDSGRACPPGFTEDIWHERTREPRRYGFHATLKAPFSLRHDANEASLVDALHAFAEETCPVAIPHMHVAAIGSFVALVPKGAEEPLEQLASSAVTYFDRFRAPLAEMDLARRLASPLTDRQRTYLTRWGYPYVMEYFRFHMTLSGALHADELGPACRELDLMYSTAAGTRSLQIDCVAVFKQESRDGRFKILARTPLHRTHSPVALP